MFNLLEEIFFSLKQHKLRNILTGFGVAWGIFILVILLSTGDGFQRGIMKLFGSYAQNSIWVYGGQSSNIDIGKTEGRFILFNQQEIELIEKRFSEIEAISPEIILANTIVSYQENHGIYSLKGINDEYFKIKILNVKEGRIFNNFDNSEKRKVVIIGNNMKDVLFEGKSPIGEFINIGGTWFKVIGVLDEGTILTQNEQNVMYIPINSLIDSYNKGNEFNTFGITLKKEEDAIKFENRLKRFLANRFDFDKFDEKALFVLNFEEQIKAFNKLFKGLKAFLFLIGACLLLSGIISIGNIMLIIVKERTKEIGIRKAIGAKSKAIISMILMESVTITFLAGLTGLFLGILLINLVNLIINQFYDKKDVLISDLSLNLPVALIAIFMIIISGCLAGLYPAKKAADIMPVEALNYEQL